MSLENKIECIKNMLGNKFKVIKDDMFCELEISFIYKGMKYSKTLRYHDIYTTEINIVFIKCFKDSFFDFIINAIAKDLKQELID